MAKKAAMTKKHGKARVRRSIKSGLSPGTPVFVGERKLDQARIDVLHYDEQQLVEQRSVDVDTCLQLARGPGVTWINVTGVHDMAVVEALGRQFGLHPLTLEDIVNTTQRPKIEESPEYTFIVLKMLEFREQPAHVEQEHVSVILGENFVISLLEDEGDVFDGVRLRIRSGKGRIRKAQADYLAYALMDAVVDHYFLAVEGLGDAIELIEDNILTNPGRDDIREIHRLKREVMKLRKAVWPLREEIGALERSDSPLVQGGTRVFLRDLYDHAIQVVDMTDSHRELLSSMHDTWLSTSSNRMNEIMKVLTIIATLFIPLTFIVGVYGMNFEVMPELHWAWGYPAVWVVMLGISAGMLLWFRRKGWF